MTGIKAFLIFPVAELDLAAVARGIGSDELVTNTKFHGSFLKQHRQVALAIRKAVGKLKAIVCLNVFDLDAAQTILSAFSGNPRKNRWTAADRPIRSAAL